MVGLIAARRTSMRTSSTPMLSCSVRTTVTSGCAPDKVVRHAEHSPQPPFAHSSAAANARAAFERPDPGGPVISQAWLIACASPAAARWSTATAASWPTSSCHTLTVPSLPYSTDNSATALDSAPPARRGDTTRPAGTACRGRWWPLDAAGLPSAQRHDNVNGCLLYTSDAADEEE